MLLELWEAVAKFLGGQPGFKRAQPILALGSLYATVVVVSYQYIQWRYGLSPSLWLYLRSYLFRQTTLAFLAFAVVTGAVLWRRRTTDAGPKGIPPRRWHASWRAGSPRAVVAGILLAALLGLAAHWAPRRAGMIRVAFLGKPELNLYALTYIVYELNRLRTESSLKVDFEVLDDDVLTDAEREQCGGDLVCVAERLWRDDRLIVVTARGLGSNSFWVNRGRTSVVSTEGWQGMEPPSVYEYVAYSLVVQSVLIHLNDSCEGVPATAFRKGWVAEGDLFDFVPRRQTMKAAILAPHLDLRDQQRLGNCFGIGYLGGVQKALDLGWLRDARVAGNLEKAFGVKI